MKAFNQSSVKFNNQRVILEYILKNGPISRAELSKQLAVSKPTISTNVNYLIENNILIEDGFHSPSVGKKGLLLHFNKNRNYIIVCDFISEIINNNILISIYNLNYEEVLSHKFTLNSDYTIDCLPILDNLLNKYILKLLAQNNMPIIKISKIVLAMSGVTSSKDLTFKRYDGRSYDINTLCNENFKSKVILRNDIKLATIAEQYFGLGQRHKNFAFIWSGLAINSGLVLNNKIFQGSNCAAGEIGLLLGNSIFTNKQCPISEIASIHGLLYSLKTYGNINNTSLIYPEYISNTLSFDDILRGLSLGDSYCINIISSIGKELGKILYNISLMLDLDSIILSGEFFKLGPTLLNEIKSELLNNPLSKVNLEFSQLNNPILLGGCKVGVDSTLSDLI